MQELPTDSNPDELTFKPLGNAMRLFGCRDSEILLSGPAGTGKSRACLEKVHALAIKYPGMRALIARKTRASITQTAMVTFERKVLPSNTKVKFRTLEQEYRYPNGSVIVVAGLDKASKIMSTEFDVIYSQEATELTENDWESLTTRLRNNVMPYQQIIADTNPDSPNHWLKKREARGTLTIFESRHEDNPTVTPEYLAKLDALTGVRLQRLRYGRWVAAEGVVYEQFDRKIHVDPIDSLIIPPHWPRTWTVDFGYNNPFVWHEWAEDPDGRLYLVREIYRTRGLVEDHCKAILKVICWKLENGHLVKTREDADPLPKDIWCDHDAEDRATFERHIGLTTCAAHKSVSDGIQAVQARLKVQPDGKPRLYFKSDALVSIDEDLLENKRPTSILSEFDCYIWDNRTITNSNGQPAKDLPVKANDHAMDSMRYRVSAADLAKRRSFSAA